MIKVVNTSTQTEEFQQYVTEVKIFGITIFVRIDTLDLSLVPHDDIDDDTEVSDIVQVKGFKPQTSE